MAPFLSQCVVDKLMYEKLKSLSSVKFSDLIFYRHIPSSISQEFQGLLRISVPQYELREMIVYFVTSQT